MTGMDESISLEVNDVPSCFLSLSLCVKYRKYILKQRKCQHMYYVELIFEQKSKKIPSLDLRNYDQTTTLGEIGTDFKVV